MVKRMNSLRLAVIGGALAAGTIGIRAPAGFVPSSYDSYALNDSYTSYAPGNAGRTTYYPINKHYQIYDTVPSRFTVGVFFYSQNGTTNFKLFYTCDVGAGNNCPGDLPGGLRGQPVCFSS